MSSSKETARRVTYIRHALFGAFFAASFFCALSGLAATENMQLNRVIAVVNGELLTLYDLQQQAIPEIMRRGLTGDDMQAEAERDSVFSEALNAMILDILYRQEAERYKVQVEDGEVENELRRIMQGNNLTEEEFGRQLALQGMTMDELRKRLRDGIMRQRLLSSMVARKAEVTRVEVEDYYNANISRYATQSSVEFSVIALGPGRDAAAVRDEITSGRISFADAARKYSEWPTAALGGSMGDIPWSDLNPAWRDAMQGLGAGETSAPVVASDSTVLLHVDSLREGTSQSLEAVAPQIENLLREAKLRERMDEYSGQLRGRAVIDLKI